MDIGSTTSHLMFARLELERMRENLSSRFVVIDRKELYRSPVAFTPYRSDGLIDRNALHHLFEQAYQEAGLKSEDISSGAVILTGLARERPNAREIAELFASEGGKFVCACAGHNLEARLAAHGSGAVALSAQRDCFVLNVDVGGGTTKVALSRNGVVISTLVLTAGARLVQFERDGVITSVDLAASRLRSTVSMGLRVGMRIRDEERQRLAEEMASAIADAICGHAFDPGLHLEGSLPSNVRVDIVTFSGGVAEFIYGRSTAEYGDLGAELGSAIRARMPELSMEVVEPNEGIRASVLGASQFSLQVSGNTIFVSDPELLPLHSVPTIRIDVDDDCPLDPAVVTQRVEAGVVALDLVTSPEPVVIALKWDREPLYSDLFALASGIYGAHTASPRNQAPLIVAIEGDLAASIGRILVHDVGAAVAIVAFDNVELLDLDFIDVGKVLIPANVVPIVIKSLVFPNP